jgi:filamentous hemagglutinin family protein
MNKSFHSIWNASKQTYVAAAETVSAKGKPSAGAKVVSAIAAVLGSLLAQSAHAQTAPPPNTLPKGGQVSAGQAQINTSGANMVILQGSDRAAINWQTFNVGKDAKVQFVQPSASSVTLNRVLGNDPSQIFGQISANGQVILTNPSGVFFGKDARVDVGGLIATTHGIGNADFMAGKNKFERNDSTASVVNEGELKATLGGYIALLAPEVRNQGAVIAHMGTVAMAAGESFDLKFDSNNRLTSLRVTPSQIQTLVDNRLAVQAPGGLVIISAQSMDRLVGGVVKNSGTVEATGLQQQGGRIVLSGSTRVQNMGTLDASSAEASGKGGNISLQGDSIELQSSSRISATGPAGGGTVLVGGNWQGSADPLLQATAQPTPAATTVSMASGATIDASATHNGDGGTAVLWSDIGGSTTFAGQILARGGAQAGRGGRVETSGHSLQIETTGRVDTSAAQGATGDWLIDPDNFSISLGTGALTTNSIGATTLVTALAGSNVTIATNGAVAGNGDISITSNVVSSSANSLIFKAHRNITQSAGVTVSTAGGAVTYWADSDNNATGNINFLGAATINTGGGNLTLAGGADSGAGTPQGSAVQITTAAAGNLSFTTAGGDVLLKAASALTGASIDAVTAMQFKAGLSIDAGAGSITMQGVTSTTTQSNGIYFKGVTTLASSKASGTAISITGNSAHSNPAVSFTTGTTPVLMIVKATGGGNINISTINSGTLSSLWLENVRVLASTGDITINSNGYVAIADVANATTIFGKMTGQVDNSSSNITINTNGVAFVTPTQINANLYFDTSGQVTIQPVSATTVTQRTSRITWAPSISGLTLGKSGSGVTYVIESPISINGPIAIYSSGTVTQTAALTAPSLALYGNSGVGTFTLNHASNNIGTIAASGVGNLSYWDSNALTIGTVGTTNGIVATGTVDIQTLTGDLTVAQNVSTTNTTSSAFLLNAGKSAAAGTASGGNLLISGTPTLSVGTGGRISLMTGSVTGSTGLTSLSGLTAGTGRFRYNADETTSFSSAPWTDLSSGVYGIYRERPTATPDNLNQVITYGDSFASSTSASGLVNGDTMSQSVTSPVYSSGRLNANATPYSISNGNNLTGFGYNVTVTANTLTVNPKTLSASGLSSANKVYDGTTTAVVTGTASLPSAEATPTSSDGKPFTGDTVSLTGTAVGNFNTKDVLTANTVTFTGLSLTGAQSGNYSLTQPSVNTTARITAKALTLSGLSSANKVYDATTTAVVNGTAVLQTAIAAGTGTSSDGKAYAVDSVSLTGTALGNFNTKDVLTANTVAFTGLSLTGTGADNYSLTQHANATTPRITAKALTVSGVTTADKVYDGTTTAVVNGTAALQTAIAAGTGTSSDGKAYLGDTVALAGTALGNFNTKDVATASTVNFTGLSLSGAQSGNYSLTQPAAATNQITRAPLTVYANNDAKFVTTADPGFTFSYSPFVAGETASTAGVLTSTPTVSADRTNTLNITNGSAVSGVLASSGTESAGTYANALVPSGAVAPNYQISYAKGSYTIVPAEQLLVRLQSASATYGSAPTYTVSSAQYMPAGGNPASPVNVGTVNVNGNAVSVNDGAGTSATFNLTPVNAALSTTLQTKAGAYQLEGSGLAITPSANPNFSRLTVVGDLSVTPKALTLNVNNATKPYDGTTAATGVSIGMTGVVTSGALTDAVSAGGNGQFAARNAGSSTYTLSNLALTGNDAGNYTITNASISGSGTITPKAVTLTAPTGTKVYDGQTTSSVTAADLTALSTALGVAGDTVSGISFNFDNKNVGTGKTLTPSAAVVSDGNSGGNYAITYASNTQSSITRLNSLTWVGGTTGNWFDPANWAGGAVPDLSNVANVVIPTGVTASFGSTVVAPAQSGAVNIDGLTGAGGNLSQSAGTLNVGTGGMVLSGLTQSGGTLTNTGATTSDSFNQSGGSFSGTGTMTAASLVQTGGAMTLGGDLSVTQNFSQGASGSVSVGGNTSITDTTAGVPLGNLTSTGTLSVTSTDGAISQSSGSVITAQSTSSFTATQGGQPAAITLGNAGNDFVGAASLNGSTITLNDVNSLTLGTVTTAGNLNATAATNLAVNGVVSASTLDLTATTGNVTQGTSSTLTVATGPTNLTAGGTVTAGGANDFNGSVNATGSTITLNDVNSLTLGTVTTAGNLNAKAATNLAVNGVVNASTLDLTATTGNVTQGTSSTLTVATGPTNLTAGGTVTAGGANDFTGSVNATGSTITLNDVNSLTLGTVTTAGNLSATAATNLAVNGVVNASTLDLTATTGNVTQGTSSTLTVATGPTNLTAGGTVTAGGANDFNGSVNATGSTITLNDVNSLTLGTVTTAGNLNATAATNLAVNGVVSASTLDLTATTGNVTQGTSSTLTVATGPTNLTAGGTVTAGGANDFNGSVNATGSTITLNDVNSLTLGTVTTAGNLNAKAATNLAVNGVVSASTLDLTATTGNVTQGTSSTLTVATGPTNLTAGGTVTAGGANDFNGSVNATGSTITLNDVNSLTLGTVTTAGNLNATAATNLAVNGVVSASTLDLTATTGNVTQGTSSTLTVATGPTNLTAGGTVTAGGANDFNGSVNATGSTITLNDVNSLTLGTVTTAGNLNAKAATNLAVNGVVNASTLDLTATTGNVTQGTSSTLTVATGPTNLTAGGTVTAGGANDFNGSVNATGSTITLNDVNSLTLGTVTTAGNLSATAATNLAVNGVVNASTLDLTATTGNVTQGTSSTLTVATGPTNLTAGGTVTAGGVVPTTSTAQSTPRATTSVSRWAERAMISVARSMPLARG